MLWYKMLLKNPHASFKVIEEKLLRISVDKKTLVVWKFILKKLYLLNLFPKFWNFSVNSCLLKSIKMFLCCWDWPDPQFVTLNVQLFPYVINDYSDILINFELSIWVYAFVPFLNAPFNQIRLLYEFMKPNNLILFYRCDFQKPNKFEAYI